MEKVRPWCGQPSDRGRLKNKTEHRGYQRCWLVHPCCGPPIRCGMPAAHRVKVRYANFRQLAPKIRYRDNVSWAIAKRTSDWSFAPVFVPILKIWGPFKRQKYMTESDSSRMYSLSARHDGGGVNSLAVGSGQCDWFIRRVEMLEVWMFNRPIFPTIELSMTEPLNTVVIDVCSGRMIFYVQATMQNHKVQ